jgi:hypothetical protein
MKLVQIVLCLGVTLLIGCATTTYKTFETRGSGVVEGNGGTKITEDGMDIWDYGEPPRKFKVLGVIEDKRSGGIIPMRQLHADMVKKAREVGGHALIKATNQAQIVGYQTIGSATSTINGNTANTTGSATTVPIRRNSAQFVVIQYVE